MEKIQFSELNCSREILRAVEDMGFEETTPIQAMAIPVAFAGKDLVGQAQTGTGKTAAFAIPMLEKIDLSSKNVQALVLCPTRELAVQISEEVNRIGKYMKGLHILPIFGGQDIERQIRGLRSGAQVIIGTPGRVLDHLRRRTLKLGNLQMLILDEADEMLNMGFREDIELVMNEVDHEIQTLLFSATMPKEILNIINKYQRNPEILKVTHTELTTPNIKQVYLEMKDRDKMEILTRLIDIYNYKLSIVFCNTKKRVDEVTDMLQARGYMCDKIHGDMKQTLRMNVINKFKRGDIEILIATDVAARGLDIDSVEAVFNYDMPSHEEYYVHRIGRTGRAGKDGISFTFITSRDFHLLRSIMRYTKSDIKPHPVPKISDLEAMKRELFLTKIKERIETGVDRKYIDIIEEFTDASYTATEVAAALFQMELEMENVKEIDSVDNSKMASRDRNDRGDRNGGDRARSGKPKRTSQGMVRMHINVGNNNNVKPRDIVGAIANEAGIEGKLIGSVDIYDSFTFVEIPESQAQRVMERMDKRMIKGKPISIEPAKDSKSKVKTSKPAGHDSYAKRKSSSYKEGGREGSRDGGRYENKDREKKRVKTSKPPQQ
ncbi:DEAD/DEAH box helicase [Fusibacter bizertensis]|uniref:DEAD/DEAH box helicase n=1 Tax=Fusibacter bizertensis TaxID=1488331 RepID=A0ABT6NC39_9FIRM|nr:DEAD/DEAH box helicase [Fusibacter bizertensis]MDH8677985.1 DEAD/DEAH box helicase [Fusibacter bizertensis]